MRLMISCWYNWIRQLILRVKCRLDGEIYFDKYDRSGAYHWEYYYEKREPFYTACVDTVCNLVPQRTSVLDIGCGDGLVSNVLNERKDCKVVGIDVHPLATALAKQRNHNANEFYVQSFYALDYQGDFDAVVAFEVFDHLRKPGVLLRKAYELLRRQGFW